MLPSPFVFLILALAAYRLTRLIGWDDFPLAAVIRAKALGEDWIPGDEEIDLPGKTPESELEDVRPVYLRPTLAHLVHCPFCLGFWISLAVYGCWLSAERPTLYATMPLALSAGVGLIAKNLDP